MRQFFKSLVVEEDGATTVEYALMIALIGAALVTVVGTLKTALETKFTGVGTTIGSSGTP